MTNATLIRQLRVRKDVSHLRVTQCGGLLVRGIREGHCGAIVHLSQIRRPPMHAVTGHERKFGEAPKKGKDGRQDPPVLINSMAQK